MGNDDTSSSALPWLWVIEYLASFKQVKASLLHAVLEVAPELPDNLGKDMREVVSLRCLEELCGRRIEIPNKGSLEDTVSKLDLSMSCEEVLASIFCHDSVSDLKEAEKKLWKWDIGSFLEHKRACMPLTALQRLNLEITEGRRLQGSTRRDIVGLASCNTRGGASAERNKPGLDTNGRNSGDHEGVTGNLVPMPMEQRDNLTKECDDARIARISPHAKRNRTGPAMVNLEESLEYRHHNKGRSPDDYSIANKLKQCQPSYLGASDPTIVPDSFDSLPKESANLEEDRLRTSEEGEILGGRAENVTLKSANCPNKCNNSVDTDLPGKIDDMLTEMVKIDESSSMSLNKEMESQQTECIPFRHDAEKISCNTNLHFDVAEHDREKLEFSNRVREQNVCMKCGEGGQLMVCHNSTCRLVFHENCVGFSAPFDADGNLYCPKCMARQDTALFLDPVAHQLDGLYKVLEQHQSVLVRDEIVEECENVHQKCRTGSVPDGYGDNSQVCKNSKKGTESGDKEKSGPSPRVCSKKKNKDILSRQGSEEKENGDTDKTENKNSMLNFQSPEVDVATNQQGKPADNLVDQVNDAPSPKLNAKGTLENANKESYCFRGRGNKEVFTMPLQRRTRQKKADWTADEEMILKEGVEKYSDRSGISWTSVLVFGGDLLKGRTTMDLKNRWNNMRRKAEK